MNKTFTVKVPMTFKEGFGVACNPCYDDEGWSITPISLSEALVWATLALAVREI